MPIARVSAVLSTSDVVDPARRFDAAVGELAPARGGASGPGAAATVSRK